MGILLVQWCVDVFQPTSCSAVQENETEIMLNVFFFLLFTIIVNSFVLEFQLPCLISSKKRRTYNLKIQKSAAPKGGAYLKKN